jgi:hypothetical protein
MLPSLSHRRDPFTTRPMWGIRTNTNPMAMAHMMICRNLPNNSSGIKAKIIDENIEPQSQINCLASSLSDMGNEALESANNPIPVSKKIATTGQTPSQLFLKKSLYCL